jgi:hypothetical protein
VSRHDHGLRIDRPAVPPASGIQRSGARYQVPLARGAQEEWVVAGQRLMQSASDIFLGWVRGQHNDFYVRQLRDMKMKLPVEDFSAVQLERYAELCGWVLARTR